MRILLDECVPRRLMRDLPGDVSTIPGIGCAGLSNGEWLGAVSPNFDLFLTLDQNLQYQQTLVDFPIAVLVVCAPSNRYEDISPLVPHIVSAIDAIRPGDLVVIPR